MAILVTGATGLIGRHLISRLNGDILAASKSGSAEGSLSTNVSRVILDLRDQRAIKLLPWSNIDVVVHLAAYTDPRESVKNSHKCFSVNASATSALLTEAYKSSVSQFVYTSSSHVLESSSTGKLDESASIGVETSYGASKAAGELQCNVFRAQTNMCVTTLRCFNVYGKGAKEYQVIPEFISEGIRKGLIETHSGNPVRDFLHVTDLVEVITYMLNTKEGGIYNVGYGRGTSIRSLASMVAATVESLTDKVVEVKFSGTKKTKDRRVADTQKLQSVINWSPQITLNDGIRRLTEYYLRSDIGE